MVLRCGRWWMGGDIWALSEVSESKCRFLLTSILDSRISHPPITARPRPIRPAPHYQLSPAATVLAFESHLVLALAKRKRPAANDLKSARGRPVMQPGGPIAMLPCFRCCWLLAAVLLPPSCDNTRSRRDQTQVWRAAQTRGAPDLNPLIIIKEASSFALEACSPPLLQSRFTSNLDSSKPPSACHHDDQAGQGRSHRRRARRPVRGHRRRQGWQETDTQAQDGQIQGRRCRAGHSCRSREPAG